MVMVSAPATVILNAWVLVPEGLPESVTWTVKLKMPAVVGVPVIVPVVDKLRPVGNVPLLIDHAVGVIPPLAVSVVAG